MPPNHRRQPSRPTITHKETMKHEAGTANGYNSGSQQSPTHAGLGAMHPPPLRPAPLPTSQSDDLTDAAPTVNRKKQKRREKAAAKLAAQNAPGDLSTLNGSAGITSPAQVKEQIKELEAQFRQHHLTNETLHAGSDLDQYDGTLATKYDQAYHMTMQAARLSGSRKDSRGSTSYNNHRAAEGTSGDVVASTSTMPNHVPQTSGYSKYRIWNTSSWEERERIKEFWLSLGEDDRKQLVKIEKDAVLKKMKEQQKHSCSCTVCGRKRTAIEEELEVLYDAYYEELEQYAHHRGDNGMPSMLPPPSRRFGALGGLQPPNRVPPALNGPQPSRGRIVEHVGDDEDEDPEAEYSDEGEEEGYSEEEPPDLPRNHAVDFFNFGNSLTVQGGILTVADDLLKNDGKKFIEMMEQLAERRMAREEDAHQHYANTNHGHQPRGHVHNHHHNHPPRHLPHQDPNPPPHPHAHPPPPPPEDEEYDEDEELDEDDEEYDSQEEEYGEEEMVSDEQCGCSTCANARQQETMTEEQRMEEGRRMFQIFAARMFEQRVLTAYKEKVARERQQKLLEELEEESRADTQKKAKKAKDAQKKKDRMAQKKQALAEEKAKREAEKAAEEAAARAEEERKLEEQRQKAEEKRKRKEMQKKAEDEERARKEAEKQRRLQEQRDRQAEIERKQREAKEKERRDKEEQRAREKEAKDRKDKEQQASRDLQIKAKAEKEARDRQRREEIHAAATAAAAAAHASKRAQQALSKAPAPIVPSPHVQVATPAVPKAPTPTKIRAPSQHDSSSSSIPATPLTGPKSQTVSPHPTTPSQSSPNAISVSGKTAPPQPFLHQPQAVSPMHAALKGPPAPIHSLPMHAANAVHPSVPLLSSLAGPRPPDHTAMATPLANSYRPPGFPNGGPPPGVNMAHIQQGRGFGMPPPPPGFGPAGGAVLPGQASGAPKDNAAPSHMRQPSGSFERPFDKNVMGHAPTQPIARPGPIGRPSSIVHGTRSEHDKNELDDLSNHLGSSALLGDSDEPYEHGVRRTSMPPANMTRMMYPTAPVGLDTSFAAPPMPGLPPWAAPHPPFGSSSLPGQGFSGGWGAPGLPQAFGNIGGGAGIRPTQPRSVAVRLMICRACKILEGSSPDGFLSIGLIKDHVDTLNPPGEHAVTEKELLDICDTEGNPSNGGGSFSIRDQDVVLGGGCAIRYEPDVANNVAAARPIGAPGSPLTGPSNMAMGAGMGAGAGMGMGMAMGMVNMARFVGGPLSGT